ncbi:MAG: tetratricopeptide repeat protein [Eggerthellaceae bacterium]|nr:tetratricopeptide repeat protein [Eggerthellaceae bacterium]
MNNELFQQAKSAMAAQDYNGACELFNQCLADEENPAAPGEVGLIYHQIGNCLIKLKSYYEAIEAYNRSTADSDYDAVGTVNCNLGMAYAALRDWVNAVKHFEIAVSDRNYPTPYKAYMGMGNALLKQGKSAEAGVAFREAALDEANPDPTKALLNLGVCFMALNRPADAVASYESALQFDMSPDTRNKMFASLGQAYVATGQMDKAVNAFENAIADKTYFLSDSASVDYQRAIAAVSQGNSENTQALPALDMSGLDVINDSPAVTSEHEAYVVDDQAVSEDYYFADQYAHQGDPMNNADYFFEASDQELEQWSRGVVKLERKRRGVGLKILVVIILLVLAALGAGLYLYLQGYGYPTQEAMVEQLFESPSDSDVYIDGLTENDIKDIASLIEPGSTIVIDGVSRGTSASTAYVTATTPEGGKITYEVSLVRNLIGWKVAGVDLYFASQHADTAPAADGGEEGSGEAASSGAEQSASAESASAEQSASAESASAESASAQSA